MSSLWSTIIEGITQLLVPSASIYQSEPSKFPAFFNPAARFNRDVSIFIYRNSLDTSIKNSTFVDCLSGVGARGMRVAKEIPQIKSIVFNDHNLIALQAAKSSAVMNDVFHKCRFSQSEVCSFLWNSFNFESRANIVDLDPFGSPSPYIDCVMRSIENGGLASFTATDTAVLLGVYPKVCYRKYYGFPLRSKYSLEIGTRLLISNFALVASRFDLFALPVFAHAYRNYIRVYCRIIKSARMANRLYENLGYLEHCFHCGNRCLVKELPSSKVCGLCYNRTRFGGPIWVGKIFDKSLVEKSIQDTQNQIILDNSTDKFQKNISIAHDFFLTAQKELDDIPFHYLNDEFGKLLKKQTLSINSIIDLLEKNGYKSSPTVFSNYGFKTDANLQEIKSILNNA